jgi:hypothetical protein
MLMGLGLSRGVVCPATLVNIVVSLRIGANRIFNSIAVFKYLVKSDLVTLSTVSNVLFAPWNPVTKPTV